MDAVSLGYVVVADVKPVTIKVYLSAVRALHIEKAFGDPLKDCLRLPLTRAFFTERLRKLFEAAGITGHLGATVFRFGAATSAALAGVPEHLIQTWYGGLAPPTYLITDSSHFI